MNRSRRTFPRRAAALLLLLSAALTGCAAHRSAAPAPAPSPLPVSDGLSDATEIPADSLEALRSEAEELLALCQDISYSPGQALSQAALDEMEALLAQSGCAVINSDSVYPAYLENAGGVSAFWDSVSRGENARTAFWGVTATGALYCRELEFENGAGFCLVAATERDGAGALFVSFAQRRAIRSWGMTSGGDFYYQDLPLNRHWDAATLLRLKPADSTLYDLNANYVLPIGYQGSNIFLCDWDSTDFGALCFNDLFGPLYRLRTGSYAYGSDFDFSEDGYFCVPAALFEDTILPRFDISAAALREKALYQTDGAFYPWLGMSSTAEYYPALLPEVTSAAENPDGSVTLTVDVMCLDRQTDRLFTHALTVLPLEDGGFRYLGNRIIYRSGQELPYNPPGLPDALRPAA